MLSNWRKSFIGTLFGWNLILLMLFTSCNIVVLRSHGFSVIDGIIVFVLFASINFQVFHIYRESNQIASLLSKAMVSSKKSWFHSLLEFFY